MKGDSDARREFIAINEIWGLDILIVAVDHAGKTVETEINGNPVPGSLLDRSESRFGQIAKGHAGGGNCNDNAGGRGRCRGQGEKAFVVEAREIQAESPQIVREKNGPAPFRVDGLP